MEALFDRDIDLFRSGIYPIGVIVIRVDDRVGYVAA